MAKIIIHNGNNGSKTIIYNNNKLEVLQKTLVGKETVLYNNIALPAAGSIGGVTNVFIAVEEGKYVQYDVKLSLRWHCLGYSLTVKRQTEVIYSD